MFICFLVYLTMQRIFTIHTWTSHRCIRMCVCVCKFVLCVCVWPARPCAAVPCCFVIKAEVKTNFPYFAVLEVNCKSHAASGKALLNFSTFLCKLERMLLVANERMWKCSYNNTIPLTAHGENGAKQVHQLAPMQTLMRVKQMLVVTKRCLDIVLMRRFLCLITGAYAVVCTEWVPVGPVVERSSVTSRCCVSGGREISEGLLSFAGLGWLPSWMKMCVDLSIDRGRDRGILNT